MSLPASVGLVVPNYNGERFLAATLDSIVQQNYPRLRCVVMDGGSNDGSLEIARAFQRRCPAIEVVSERDEGQADAIAKGMRRLDTDLVGWLNSDDMLLPGTLQAIAEARTITPTGALFYGDLELCDDAGRLFSVMPAPDLDYQKLRSGRGQILQPGSLYSREHLQRAGGVRKEFWGLMDLDLWIRLLAQGPAVRLPRRVAQFRVHPAAKSSEQPLKYYRESLRIMWKYNPDQRLRALLPKLRGIPLHFLRWVFDIHTNAYQPPPSISSPPHVQLDLTTLPSAVATVLGEHPEFQTAFGTAPPQAAVDMRVVDTDTALLTSLSQRANKSLPQIPIIVATKELSEARALRLTKLRGPLAFVLTTPKAGDTLRHAGFPEFRIGDRSLPEDWLRAVHVAAGQIFAEPSALTPVSPAA